MNCKLALAIVTGLLMLSSPSWAQTTGPAEKTSEPPAHRFEILPMVGYVWTGSQSATYSGSSGDVDFKSSEFYGIALEFVIMPDLQGRLLYRRQDTQLTFKQPGSQETLGDVAIEYWHLGATGVTEMDNVVPFGSVTLGGTRYAFDGGDSWKFSMILGAGAKIYLNDRIGLMAAAEMPFTFTSAFFGAGSGGLTIGGTGIFQFDVTVGLTIRI